MNVRSVPQTQTIKPFDFLLNFYIVDDTMDEKKKRTVKPGNFNPKR